MMKKIIAMLLLCALCVTFLTSCDLSGGLIGELLAEMNQNNVDIDPIVDALETADVMIDPVPPVEIETVYDALETEPPVEYTTEDWIEIEPTPDVLLPLNLQLDGDLSDWTDEMCVPLSFDKSNLDAWFGEVGDGAGFTMRMTADETYVYFAFDVQDSTVVLGNRDGYQTGDFFQIQMDLNGEIGASEAYERAIFYSFCLQADGTMDVTVQCIYGDAASDISYRMASDDDPGQREGEIIGTTRAKADESGWIAEFAISWETLYRDLTMKLKNNELPVPEINAGIDEAFIKMLVCYIDCEQPGATLTGGWGTPNKMGDLMNGLGWYPENAGVIVHLFPQEGRGSIDYVIEMD